MTCVFNIILYTLKRLFGSNKTYYVVRDSEIDKLQVMVQGHTIIGLIRQASNNLVDTEHVSFISDCKNIHAVKSFC